ncbi:MAG: mannose-1-phosphate guanylyltransferase/mannose-6-phosphate isomerase, partial [Sphingomonadaceae bacterium]|nr:mannose-1-phosphate guanylyltransferase/mannose-6-phosphate isomerase [Sphingomonadaceae bacterium]
VILAGGSGTRLWPLSRQNRAKQFLPLLSDKTMLGETLDRVGGDLFGEPLLVGGVAQADMLGEYEATLILEPVARNTAAAIALAALSLPRDATMLVMPSDHVIADRDAFMAAIAKALPLALQGWLVTFGIEARGPETGYGYIKSGEEVGDRVFEVERFVEKPDRATAEGYLAEGGYHWNGGIFLFSAGAYLDALKTHAPEIAAAARKAMDDDGAVDADAFAESPSISIDYAVMEKARKVAVVPVSMGWSDIGSWDALYDISDKDDAGNAAPADAVTIDSANCLIRADGQTVAAIGVEDLIVVATGDAVLVMPRGDSQRVKEAVEALKAKNAKVL